MIRLAQHGYVAGVPLNFVFRILEGGIVNVYAAHHQFIVYAPIPKFGLVGGFKNDFTVAVEDDESVIADSEW